MKVGQTNDALPVDRILPSGVRPAGNGPGGTPEVSAAGATDKVELSKASQQLSARSDPDSIDLEKVDRVRAMIAEGKFKVDVQKVAATMINEAASLLETIVLGKAKP
jgi:flagellar biosynthesis anti-sigma factor FlgM